ncbi:MAG: 50S ribosomal protein L32 [Bacillota bacterium]
MGVPKRKTSKSKSNSRRAVWSKIASPGLVECPQCHALRLSHRACPSCGYYKSKKVLAVE